MESPKYQAFCLADQTFFDSPARMPDADTRFAQSLRPAPEHWRGGEYGLWTVLTPQGMTLPAQGWKIHLSATVPSAPDLLDLAWDYCVGQRLAFKFLRSRAAMAAVNAKEGSRGSSGKLVTIYLPTGDRLATVLPELAGLLDGFAGPYVLSDLRYGRGPAYVRYGAFTELYCAGDDGEPIPALRGPDGSLVPDERGPVFAVPDWVPIPDVLRPSIAARQAGAPTDFPYVVRQAFQFSNSGGVYLATERATGAPVVLREARPHAGLDRDGRDAIDRLEHEHAILTRLSDLDCVPRALGRHTVWEHEFLVEEYIEGDTLLAAVINRYPLVHPDPTTADLDAYRTWAADVLDRVEDAVAALHARGVRFGDLHPGNVIVRPDGRVALVDFELAAPLDEPGGAGQGAPGFAAPPGFHGADIDHYAMESLRLYLLLPMTQLLARDRAKAATLIAAAREVFPQVRLPGVQLLRQYPGGAPDPAADLFAGEPDWPAIRASLVAGIHASATPQRTDRLFPGDPNQFVTGGLALRSGAAGVLYALHQAGEHVPEQYVDWLVGKARRGRRYLRGGLYDGLYGVAGVLDLLGHLDTAREILDLARAETERVNSVGLLSGGAGIGLTLQHFADRTGDAAYAEAAARICDDLAAVLRGADGGGGAVGGGSGGGGGMRPPATAGLMRGFTGAALLFLHRYERTGDPRLLDLAGTALRRDLSRTVPLPDGTRQVHDGTSYLAYLDNGSAGIAPVLQSYLRHRPDPDLVVALGEIRRACRPQYVYQPGLLRGRGGLILVLSQLGLAEDRPVIRRHIRNLAWHALSYHGELAFPGHAMSRLSMDLATGSAGVLLALCAALHENPAGLPYLDPRRPVAIAPTTVEGGEFHVVRA